MLLTPLALTRRPSSLFLWSKLPPNPVPPGPRQPRFLIGSFSITQKNALWSLTSHRDARGSRQRTATVPGDPTPNIKQVIPTTPGMLKGVLHTKNHSFIKSPLVMNDISNVLGKKNLPLADGAGHKAQRELLLPAFSHVHAKGSVPGLWSKEEEMIESVTEVGLASRSGPSSREE